MRPKTYELRIKPHQKTRKKWGWEVYRHTASAIRLVDSGYTETKWIAKIEGKRAIKRYKRPKPKTTVYFYE